MNYYPHHIGDFRSGTFNMTKLERWIYRDMLDVYYDREEPFPDNFDKIFDMIGARRVEEREIVAALLLSKFEHTERGYVHERCEREIAAYHAKADTARINGKRGGRPPKQNPEKPSGFLSGCNPEPDRNQIATGSKANQEPITKNQRREANGSRLPSDWKPSAEETAFCKAERPDLRPSEVAQRFFDYWSAIPGAKGRKVDWSATWRNWVRAERPGKAAPEPLKRDWL